MLRRENPICLESEIKPIKCPEIYPNEKILCVLYATDCPVFKVKAKINVPVPSDVIN